ncbi:MAG: hypothetical protein HGB23_00475 [Chlorobiaceae bacterium]|nr:hypothetical protein [Chlorobiaceae bacterium]
MRYWLHKNIRLQPVWSGILFLGLCFLYTSCSPGNNTAESIKQLYLQASSFKHKGEYLKAIEFYNKALVLDSLNSTSPEFVAGLNEKRVLEGLTGSYYEALRTTIRLEKLPEGALSDSLRNAVLVEKAAWLRELGSFRAAVAALEKVASPTSQIRFELASLYREFGECRKAAEIYGEFTGMDRDPAIRITALAGQLQCKVADPELDVESSDALAGKIAAESGRVFSMQGALVERIEALRFASKSLQLLEKHRRNASYLLFRALTLAEESKNQMLVQILRFESNAVIVRKPDSFREAAEYFRIKNLQYARSAALFMLAESSSIDEAERVSLLQQGFSASRNSAPPYPGDEFLRLEKSASRRLVGLLLGKSRIFELFDATEQAGYLALQRSIQRDRRSIIPGKEHAVLNAEVCQLQHEISGLQQRKADIFFQASGYEKQRAADQAINIKRGRLLELVSQVRAINPRVAELMRFAPETLHSVQGTLKEDQALLMPLISDSLCGVMLIGKRQLEIAGGDLGLDSLHTAESAIDGFRRELAHGARYGSGEQAWFTKAFYTPLSGSIDKYRQLIIVSDDLFPFHISGLSDDSVPERRYSFLQSIAEFSLLTKPSNSERGVSQIYFYPVENVSAARIHKLFAPRDRVFLLWKKYSLADLDALRQQIALAMQGTVSASEAMISIAEQSSTGRETWKYISSYGKD